jgi:effector-binding domain-containing protein
MAEALIATAVPRLLASVRRQATASTIAGLIRGSGVWDLMRSRNIQSTGHNVVVYWDEPGRDLMHSPGGIPVDIGAEITAPFEDDGELHCTRTPAGRLISMQHIGDYAGLGAIYAAIYAYCRQAGLKTAGPYWEFYGHWNDDPARLETTVYCALAEQQPD